MINQIYDKLKDIINCPVCDSRDVYWQLSGVLTCKRCDLNYASITRNTINDPVAIKEAVCLFKRMVHNPGAFGPRTPEQQERDKVVLQYHDLHNKPELELTHNQIRGLYGLDPIKTPEKVKAPTESVETTENCDLCDSGLITYETRGVNKVKVCQNCDYEEYVGEKIVPVLKDSGARREFETGAVREISEGKGRCDLLPLDVVSGILEDVAESLWFIEEFKKTKDVRHLRSAIKVFIGRDNYDQNTLLTKGVDSCIKGKIYDICTAMLDVSKHFEAEACKYGENNWKKGIPLHCYLDSAVRHYLKHLRGDTDGPHDRAFICKLLCAIWTFEHMPELDDVERDICKDVKEEVL